jgi:hypothetical protein
MVMKFRLRGSVVAAIVIACFLNCGIASQIHAQQTSAVQPELAAEGVWNAATTYAKDDIVTARGSAWISLRSGNTNRVPGETRRPSARWWGLFARGFNPSGAWSNATGYQPDDLVTHNGQTYRAKITHTNRQPANTRFWELLVIRGAAGVPGTIGPQGPQGPQGPAGPNTGISGGTLAAPGISFDGDPDTGIYSPQAGRIAMVGNGALFLHNLGFDNTALGASALAANTGGFNNTALGASALATNTTGDHNTALGAFALTANATGNFNTAIGLGALAVNTSGSTNTALGPSALVTNTTGFDNTAVGGGALGLNMTGSRNIAVGASAGSSADNPNHGIFIGNLGLSGDTNTIKIGTQGTQFSAFIAGIYNATSTGGIGVFVNSDGQLGTATSSRRYKDGIAPIDDAGAMLASLRPVTFRYKQADADGAKPRQYGLIAEEVEAVTPDLAAYNKDGTVETVKYHFLPPLLLAGWQAQQKTIATQAEKIETQSGEIAELKERLAAIEAMLPRAAKAAARQ